MGYETDMDMTLLLLVVMQCLGDHLREKVRMEQAEEQEVAVYELLAGETEWYVVGEETRKDCFDILHVLMRLFFILLDAETVQVDTEVVVSHVKEMSSFQYESSLPASQVLYFHQPTYTRQRQVEFESITSLTAGDINVLPIILQLKPDVPVFFEHTGACNSSTCCTSSCCRRGRCSRWSLNVVVVRGAPVHRVV
jgi:hypothetical protein